MLRSFDQRRRLDERQDDAVPASDRKNTPAPPRIAVRPSPVTSQAKPTRGAPAKNEK